MKTQQKKQYVNVPRGTKQAMQKLIDKNIISKRRLSLQVLKYDSVGVVYAILTKNTKMHVDKLERLEQFIEENKGKIGGI